MDGFIGPPLAPSRGGLPITRILFVVRDYPGVEDHLAIVRGIKAAIEVDIGTSAVQTDLFDSHL
jgi:hypothetical protein